MMMMMVRLRLSYQNKGMDLLGLLEHLLLINMQNLKIILKIKCHFNAKSNCQVRKSNTKTCIKEFNHTITGNGRKDDPNTVLKLYKYNLNTYNTLERLPKHIFKIKTTFSDTYICVDNYNRLILQEKINDNCLFFMEKVKKKRVKHQQGI